MSAIVDLTPLLLFAGLLGLVIFALRSMAKDRQRGSLASSLEALQETFEPQTRKAHELREEQRESQELPGDSRRR